jgi:DNA invertase Pin-like site-specific DNA recombinase
MNEPTHFDLVTIGGGFAGPYTAVLEAGTDASYLMLTVLGGLAEFERDWIRARTSEGRERAKARGVKLGVKPKLTEHQRREAIWRRDCRRRAATRHRPHLRRIAQHDLSTDSATGQPFRRRSGYKMMR